MLPFPSRSGAAARRRIETRVHAKGRLTYESLEARLALATVPGTPAKPLCSPIHEGAIVSWTAPASNGGSAIRDYVIQYSSDGGSSWVIVPDGVSTATTTTVTGLVDGTSYMFQVAAVNAVGRGTTSSSATVLPTPASLTVTDVSGTLTTTYGTASAAKTFTVRGSALADKLTVAAPSGIELSTSASSGYVTTLTLSPVRGTVGTTTIYARLKAKADARSYDGVAITVGGGGADPHVVSTSAIGNVVAPKTVTITGAVATTRAYDGTTVAAIKATVLQGVVSGDTLTVSGGGTFAQAAVGKAIAVTPALSLAGPAAANYRLKQPTGLKADIIPRSLAITGISVADRIYDGTKNAALTGTAAYAGLANGESFAVVGTASASFADKNAGKGKPVTISGFLAPSGNYALAAPKGFTASISPKPLTIDGVTAVSKPYDGKTTATLAGKAVYSGLIAGDSFAVRGTPSATFATKAAGSNKPVTVQGYMAPSGNYVVTQPAGLTANITPKTVTVTAASAASRAYDGTTSAAISGGTLKGVLPGDIVTLSGSGTFTQASVGTGIAVVPALTLGGVDGPSYVLEQPSGLKANITPKTLAITGLVAQPKTYDGTTAVTLTGTAAVSGAVAGDDVGLAGTVAAAFASKNAGTRRSVGVSGFALAGTAAANYSLAPLTLAADIAPKSLTITADGKSRLVNAVNPPLTATISGFIPGETAASALTGAVALATSASPSSPAGKYAISVSQGSLAAKDGNYAFNYSAGELTVVGPPGSPLGVVATAGDGAVTLEWIAPAVNGGGAITEYVVEYRLTTAATWTRLVRPPSTDAVALVTGLVNGKSYVFHVAAVNVAGAGTFSENSAPATPSSMTMVAVGNPGNASDTNGYGTVDHSFRIGAGDVTIVQYVAFLNAVAKADPYGLYDDRMGTDLNVAGISRSGGPGAYSYNVMSNGGSSAKRPITYVSWFDAARFANWMANGQPATGVEDASTTEDGAYALAGRIAGDAVARNAVNSNTNAAPVFFIPTEKEWYKAAYYDPTLGESGGYWTYATRSDAAPGNQIGGNANQANVFTDVYSLTGTGDLSATSNFLTDVGAFTGSGSSYGTFDQSGNVGQWTDLDGLAGQDRVVRGGSWADPAAASGSSVRSVRAPAGADARTGFRLVAPEKPATPLAVEGAAGYAQATLSWEAPTDTGGSSLEDYVVQFSVDGGSNWTTYPDGVSAATRATVTGLATDATYVFRVAAVNVAGRSAFSSAVKPAFMTMANVGDVGNAADTTGYGAVDHAYRIGTNDVTIWQYTAFLNAVAKTDPYGLYHLRMGIDLNVGGISRSGSAGSYTYGVVNSGGSSANRPITYVNWFDAARFANWMANGQPATGVMDAATTEDGAYTLDGKMTGDAVARNATNPNTHAKPTYFIPTENEWYKAAYYDPTKDGVGGYWKYATRSDSAPGNQVGDGANQANFNTGVYTVTQSATFSTKQNYLTDVGAFTGSSSYYGTFDQAGNVYQWNDLTGFAGSERIVRGGSWYETAETGKSTFRTVLSPSFHNFNFGFRLVAAAQ